MECNPNDYMLKDDHDRQCDRQHEAAMMWAHEAVNAGAEDRKNMKHRISLLEAFKEKAVWGVMGGLFLILLSIWAAPYITKNGDSKVLNDLQHKINMVVDKQAAFDSILKDVREDQQRRERREK